MIDLLSLLYYFIYLIRQLLHLPVYSFVHSFISSIRPFTTEFILFDIFKVQYFLQLVFFF